MGNNPSHSQRYARTSCASRPTVSVERSGRRDQFCNKLSEREDMKPFYEIEGGMSVSGLERAGLSSADGGGVGIRLPGRESRRRYSLRRRRDESGRICLVRGNSGSQRTRWARNGRTRSGSMTCTGTCGSGAGTGSMRVITVHRRWMIRAGPARAREAGAPGRELVPQPAVLRGRRSGAGCGGGPELRPGLSPGPGPVQRCRCESESGSVGQSVTIARDRRGGSPGDRVDVGPWRLRQDSPERPRGSARSRYVSAPRGLPIEVAHSSWRPT